MTHSDTVHGYSAGKAPSPWLRILTGLFTYPLLAVRNRVFVANFTHRELASRFQGSILGPVWVLIHPFFLFAVYWTVFGFFFDLRNDPTQPSHWYALYLLSGVLAWTVFAETAFRSCNVILENGNLIKKVAFPSELLPLHLVVVNLIVFLVGILAFFAIGFFLGGHVPSWLLLFMPLVLLLQLLFTLGVGLFLACANVFLRDTAHIFGIVAQAWFFFTPVFWHPRMFGEEKMALIDPFVRLNPMYHVVGAHRTVLGIIPGTAEDVLRQCAIALFPAFVCFMLGYAFFKAHQHRFADEV